MSLLKSGRLLAALVLVVLAAVFRYSIRLENISIIKLPFAGDIVQIFQAYNETKSFVKEQKISQAKCTLPGFKTREQCQRINKSLKGGNCSYYCNCYKYTNTVIPREYSEPLLLPKQDMVNMEALTLYDPEFLDVTTSPSAEKSKVSLVNPNQKLVVGDTFKVIIQLFDAAGRPRRLGGDHVRVWMASSNKEDGFSAAGDVLDLSNGTYVATIKALWDGPSVIYVKLARIREEIATNLRWLRQYRVLYYYEGVFSNSGLEEKTVCCYFPMDKGTMCNFTTLNGGQPWYCKKPSKLKCEDLQRFESLGITPIPFTDAQKEIINRAPSKRLLKTKLIVNVSKGTLPQPSINCKSLNISQTWDTRMPTGYIKGNEWRSLKCKNTLNIASLRSCLTNTSLILMGDSTTRQYYVYLTSKIFTDCILVTEKWKRLRWDNPTKCVSTAKNLSIVWNPHELPFTNARRSGNTTNLRSTEVILNGLNSSQNVIFVIHYYAHLTRSHYSILLHKLRHLKTVLRKVLLQNKKVKLLIKSPHSFDEFDCVKQVSDVHGPFYIELIKRELQEFQDSIVYVNVWEMSVAFENYGLHPEDKVLWQNLRMLFGYICS